MLTINRFNIISNDKLYSSLGQNTDSIKS